MFIGHEITHGFDNRGIFSVKDSAGIKVFKRHETEYIKLNEQRLTRYEFLGRSWNKPGQFLWKKEKIGFKKVKNRPHCFIFHIVKIET